MKSLLKYLRAFQMGFQSGIEYRADFSLSIVSVGFIIIIQTFLWRAVFSSSGSSIVYGYTFPQMISYCIMAGLVDKIVSTGFEMEIAEDVKSGGLNKFIVQPIEYFIYRLSCFFGSKVLQTLIVSIISILALSMCNFYLGLEIQPMRILLFFPIIVLSMVLNFLIYYCLSALTFIMVEVWGVFAAAGQVVLILSGGIFPLDIFGEGVYKVLSLLPFKYIVFYPVNIVNGRLPMDAILSGVIIQSIWILILLPIANYCWNIGMKKYVSVGG